MDWLLLETGVLINASLITDLRYTEHGTQARKASAWCAGVLLASESTVLGQWYEQKRDEILKAREEAKAAAEAAAEAEAAKATKSAPESAPEPAPQGE